MSDQSRRLAFPVRVGAPDVAGDDIAVLMANGTWSGDPAKLQAALARMPHNPGDMGPVVMWLVLREMQRG